MEGKPIVLDGSYPRVPGANTLDALGAAASALRAFVAGIVFCRSGGESPTDRAFKLNRVYSFWPDPSKGQEYPTAVCSTDTFVEEDGHNFVPTSLDETWHQFGCDTVLWKTSELVGELQLDFFASDEPTRAAIMAALPAAFSPGEERSGVMVEGSPDYFSRPVRLTLRSHRRVDVADAVFDMERRITCRVGIEVDEVHLRCARPLNPQIVVAVEPG